MGNCLKHEAQMEWGGDYCGSTAREKSSRKGTMMQKEERLLRRERYLPTSRPFTTTDTEAKIKISKKTFKRIDR